MISTYHLQGSTYWRCPINAVDYIKMLDDIGLGIHLERCVIILYQYASWLNQRKQDNRSPTDTIFPRNKHMELMLATFRESVTI